MSRFLSAIRHRFNQPSQGVDGDFIGLADLNLSCGGADHLAAVARNHLRLSIAIKHRLKGDMGLAVMQLT
jgi:hypothetical protein